MILPYYKILGFNDIKISQEDIKARFRSLSKTCHPDIFPDDPDKEEEFKRLSEAYETLSDPNKRAVYDTKGYVTPSREAAIERAEDELIHLFNDIFEKVTDDRIEGMDMKGLMLKGLKESRENKRRELQSIEKAINKLERAAKRIKCHNSKNLIKEMLEKRIDAKIKHTQGIYEDLTIIDLIEELAEDYSYDNQTGNFLTIGV